jgi:hypothetical protein
MELVGACLEAVAYLRPKRWLLENPMGRLRWFLGKPEMTLRLCDFGAPWQKKTDFWGNVPLGLVDGVKAPRLYVRPMAKGSSRSPLVWVGGYNKAQRSFLPRGLSEAILNALEVLA